MALYDSERTLAYKAQCDAIFPASHSAVVIVVLLFVRRASQAAVLGAFVLVSSAGMLFA